MLFSEDPVQCNVLKHHLPSIREFIRFNRASATDPQILANKLLTAGNNLTDIYVGSMDIEEICAEIKTILQHRNILERRAFCEVIAQQKGAYLNVSISDQSVWTLCYSASPCYLHIHPARNGIKIYRLKSKAVKVVIMHAVCFSKQPLSVLLINEVRTKYFGLSPLKNTLAIEEAYDFLINRSFE